MPFIEAKRLTDRKDRAKKLMVFCVARGGKRHPISVCARYCPFFGGLRVGGIECKWHTTDGEVKFRTREDRLPEPGDTSVVPDLFDVPDEAALTLL